MWIRQGTPQNFCLAFIYELEKQLFIKISHICEEGGAHLRISLWHLLINFKNNYLKNCWSRPIKNKIILIFNILIFNDMIYSSWDIEQNILKLVILGHFLPFYPPKNPKNQNFEKMKKFAGDFIILHMCTKNHFNHKMYGSWDTVWDRQNFLSFCTTFCLFTLLWTRKIKILKKRKKHLKTLSFYKCVPKMTVIWCMVPEIWSATDRFFVILHCFLPFYPPNNSKN